MRIKIAKKKQQKINDIHGITDWCQRNIPELTKHYEDGCDYARWWVEAMDRDEREQTRDSSAAYVSSILKYLASHHPDLLGDEYQWAVDIERGNGKFGIVR